MCGSSLEPAHIAQPAQAGRTMRLEGRPCRAGLGSEHRPCVAELSTAGPVYLGGECELRPVSRHPGGPPWSHLRLAPLTLSGPPPGAALSLTTRRCKGPLQARDLPRVCTVTASAQRQSLGHHKRPWLHVL